MFFILLITTGFVPAIFAIPPQSKYVEKSGPISSAIYATNLVTVTQMNDTTASKGLSDYSGRPIVAEYASSTSFLVGKSIDTITVDLRTVHSPSGPIQVGIFKSDLSVKQLFGTIDASTVTTKFKQYTVSLPAPQSYKIQSGDRIGIKFTGGSPSKYIEIMTDDTNSFDGTNSYLTLYTKHWENQTKKDLTMTLTLHTLPPIIKLKGSNPLTMGRGSIYIDPGATAVNSDGDNLTSSIVTINQVNPEVVGTYNVAYSVSDPTNNVTQTVTRTVNVIDTSPVLAMNDFAITFGVSAYSGIPIRAEFVSDTSSLIGKSIDTIVVDLRKTGSPSGTIQIGIFNNDQSVKALFGTINATNLLPIFDQYSFSLPPFQTYQIQSGDRIGIKFTGGDSSNYIVIMSDQNGSFDSTNSFLTYYQSGWHDVTAKDLSLILEQVVISTDLPIVIPPPNILSVTTNSSRNIPNLGAPTVFDRIDSLSVITNNSTGTFPVGNTTVLWLATNSIGNIGAASQRVSIISVNQSGSIFNRVAMINFDDDYRSIYTLGKPILDKYGIKATDYFTCDFIGQGNNIDWNLIHALQADGQDIQAHTMTHPDSNHLSQSQLDYQYGQDISCFTNNGTAGVHMVAMPLNAGYNNATVINTIAKYYDMARGGGDPTFFLHCNNQLSGQTNCETYNSQGKLNLYNRYNIRSYTEQVIEINDNFTDALTFSAFVKEVNSANTNTSANSTQIPIVIFHRVVLDNSVLPPDSRGITTTLLDAEMKYLIDNNFKIWTTKDLAYDTVTNTFYLKGP